MKVLHIVPGLGFGGLETRMEILGSHGVQDNDLSFIAIANSGEAAKFLSASGLQVSALGLRARIPSICTLVRLVAEIRARRPTVVHTHGAEANFHGILAATLAGVRLRVAEEIGIANHSNMGRLVFRFVYSLATVVVAISRAVANRLIESGEAPRGKIRVIHNPVRKLSAKKVQAGDVFSLGFIGRLEPEKNPLALIEAVQILRQRGRATSLVLVGEGSQRAHLESEVEKLGLHDQVLFAGYSRNPIEALGNCNLLVQPSYAEGFGLAVAEAMYNGIPVLVPPTGGTIEFVSHEKNGWVLRSVDSQTIASEVARIAKLDGANRESIGEEGRRVISESFSITSYIKALDNLYAEL